MPDMYMDVDAALAEVPVNMMPLIDSGDFVTVEDAVAYDAAGMDLRWNFVTTAGAYTSTAVTPTTGGTYDWTHQGDGMYSIEIPASGGASINNNAAGFGWFTGKITGVLPFRGPVIGFRAAALNNLLIDDAFSTTRGLAGTALPNAAADAAGGLPISDVGGLDLDAKIGALTYGTANRVNVQVYGMEAGTVTAAAIADGAIDAATFAADVDAEILSYIVDDATRIDASALNTATGTTIPAILDDTDLIDDGTSGLAKIATDVAAILVDTAEIGAAGAGLTNINLPDQTMNIVGNITGNLSGSVGSVTGNTPQTGDAYAIVNSITHGNAALKTLVDATPAGVLAAATTTPIAANVKKVNDTTVDGSGTTNDPWGPA